MSEKSTSIKSINVRMSVRMGERDYRQTQKLSEATGVTVFRNGIPKRDFDKAVSLLREKMSRTSRVNLVEDGLHGRDITEQFVQLVRDQRIALDEILNQPDDDGSQPPF